MSEETLLAFYKDKVASWQVPDTVIFVDDLPLGATGKVMKNRVLIPASKKRSWIKLCEEAAAAAR